MNLILLCLNEVGIDIEFVIVMTLLVFKMVMLIVDVEIEFFMIMLCEGEKWFEQKIRRAPRLRALPKVLVKVKVKVSELVNRPLKQNITQVSSPARPRRIVTTKSRRAV